MCLCGLRSLNTETICGSRAHIWLSEEAVSIGVCKLYATTQVGCASQSTHVFRLVFVVQELQRRNQLVVAVETHSEPFVLE